MTNPNSLNLLLVVLLLCIPPTPALAQSMLPPTPEWSDDTFQASVYPSITSAVRAMSDHWGREFATRRRVDPREVLVNGSKEVPPEALSSAVDILCQHFPTAQVRHVPDLPKSMREPSSSSDTMEAYFHYTKTNPGAGFLMAWGRVANVQEKPWVTEFAAFSNRQPSKRWVVGRSGNTAVDEVEAHQQARTSAAAGLVSPLRHWLQKWDVNQHLMDDDRLTLRLAKHLSDPAHRSAVQDQFTQTVQRPYGTLWRHAVLVEASSDNLDRLARAVAADVQYERTWLRRTIVSAVGLSAVIFLLYMAVNAITKGYFKWRLRTATAVGLAAVIVLVLVLS